MKLTYSVWAVGLTLFIAGCSTPSAKDDGIGHDHSHHSHESEEAGHHHDDEIHLSDADAGRFGVMTTEVQSGDFAGSLNVSGQLLAASGTQAVATAPSSGVVRFCNALTPGNEVSRGMKLASVSASGMTGGDAVENARITFEAAKRELDRLTPLHADGIVSTSAFNAALQTYESAKAAYTGGQSGATVTAPIKGIISTVSVSDGQYVDAGAAIAVITDGGELTLRADVPETMAALVPSFVSAKLRAPGQKSVIDITDLGSRRAASRSIAGGGSAPAGYLPVYFTFRNPGTLQPGGYVDVYLLTAANHNAVAVPRSALIEQEGNYFVFVKVHHDAYEKRMVTLGDTDGENVEIVSGIAAGDNVVTRGATIVKLAASSGKVPEGHSHNH